MNHFEYRDGRLFAEDVAVADLAAAVGTPFYCYSTATLRRHYEVFAGALAGQFAMLSAGARSAVERTDPLLPRPMAVYRFEGEVVEILYKVHGRGTQLMAEMRPDDEVRFVGPLGRGFDVPGDGATAFLVATPFSCAPAMNCSRCVAMT